MPGSPVNCAFKSLLVALILIAVSRASYGQDRRNVVEPKIPPVCAIVTAVFTAIDNHTTLPPPDEQKLDTARIQQAIDRCPPGRAVELTANGARNAFLSGALQLRTGITLLVDEHAILFASRNPRDYDVTPRSCGIVDRNGRGCKALIDASHVANAAVMGGGVIDGRGWATLLGGKSSWWDLAEQARTGDRRQNCPRLIQLVDSNNFTLYRITLKNAPNFHVFYSGGDGFTAWGVIIDTPKTARNTDGIDPSSATDVTITHCYIHAGDDNVAIKAGNSGPSSHITIAQNHFYTGHGMSIGSETNGGVSAVRVTGLSIDGADNGIRIKSNSSRGGLVHDVVYQDVCIRNTRNPVLLDTHYSFYGHARNLLPVFNDVTLRRIRVFGLGKITLQGYDATHRLGIHLDNVILDAPAEVKIVASHAAIALGPGPVNFRPSGDDVSLTGNPGRSKPIACSQEFVPMPRK
ncbi:MAG: glycoside hydrolase family 28 protein [Candidatus Acidiferrales bacterium]